MDIKGNRKNLIKITAMTSMTIFGLFALFSGTIAWFGMNQSLNTQNDGFGVTSSHSLFRRLTFHKIVQSSDSVYRFDASPIGEIELIDQSTRTMNYDFSEGSPFEMGKYDYLEKSHPVLMLLEFWDGNPTLSQNEDLPLEIKVETHIQYYLGDGERRLFTQDEVSSGIGYNPLSSVLQFSSFSFPSSSSLAAIEGSLTQTEDGNDVSYDTFDVARSILSAPCSFVEFEGDSYADFDGSIPLFQAPNATTVKYVGIIFDYYEVAVETIYNSYIGDPALDDELLFYCDWMVVI